MTRLRPQHIAELRELREMGDAIVDGLAVRCELGELGPQLKAALAGAFDIQNLRGMRMAVRDLQDMLDGLAPAQRQELIQAVEQNSGVSLARLRAADAAIASGILRRGRIRNNREYYVMRSQLELMASDPDRATEAGADVRLLDSYRVS